MQLQNDSEFKFYQIDSIKRKISKIKIVATAFSTITLI